MVGGHRIEVVPRRKTAIGQLLGAIDIVVRWLPHRHQHDPFAGRGRVRRALHDLDDVGHRMQSGDRNAAARLEAFAVGMRMGVEQPRQHR